MSMWFFALIGYILLGLTIILATPARIELLDSFRDKALARVPAWKRHVYRAILGTAALILWPVFLPDWLRKKRTPLDDVQEVGGKLIVSAYRRLGEQNRCAPTGKTSDQKIIEIYSRVGTAFRQASKQRGEHIPAVILNFIVFKFLQVYEMMGEEMFQEHLQYEVDKYLAEGLRPDYRQELPLF